MYDGMHDEKVIYGLTPQTINGNTTTSGSIVDTDGYEEVLMALGTGTVTDGDYSISGVEEGDASNLSDTAALPAAERVGDLPAFTADADDNKLLHCVLKPTKRYIRPSVLSTTGGSGATSINVIFVLRKPRHAPTRTTADAAQTQVP
jgi:hypothetical protein